ncbi:MAG: transposase family protein [Patescibacteria group bacterium]|jgi:hypothetical protein
MNLRSFFRDDRATKALLGMGKKEFEELIPAFEQALKAAYKEVRPDRKRKIGGGKIGILRSVEEKLAFVLFYLKTYPTFDVLGAFTGRDRSRSCRSAHFLFPVLEKTLKIKLVLPTRQIRSVEELLETFPEAREIFLDGVERPVQKPTSQKRKKKLYSGKKKMTTRKSVIATDGKKRIGILTPTKSGRRHDKRLSDKADFVRYIPEDMAIITDTGFQGIQTMHTNTLMPKKGSKKHPLSTEDKQNNRLISSVRILVEHAIAGIKRFKAAADIYRNRKPNLDDQFMLLSAGLWNLHLQGQTI